MKLFIDPGRTTGCAVFDESRLVAAWIVKCELLENFVDPGSFGEDEVWIEFPRWYGVRNKIDANDLIALAGLVGQFKRRYESAGCRVQLVAPRDWKGTIEKSVHNRRTLKALTADEFVLLPKTPRGLYDHNMLDAVGMGLWEAGRIR